MDVFASGAEEAAATARMKAFWGTLADPRTGMAQVCGAMPKGRKS
jgi:hypothetical protein